MTRTEIETQALSLPEKERAALAGRLAESLEDPRQLGDLAPAVYDAYRAKLEAWRQRLETEMDSWFDPKDGPGIELTDEVWDQIMSDARSDESLDEPFGDGVPPEWTGRTRRELREAIANGELDADE